MAFRPLKKGTARLAVRAWEENIPLRVLPLGINYSSFERIGKNVFINFGDYIDVKDIDISVPMEPVTRNSIASCKRNCSNWFMK